MTTTPELLPQQFPGVEYSTEFYLDYDFFDSLTLGEAFNLTTIHTDRDYFIACEDHNYVTWKLEKSKDEPNLCPDSRDLTSIVDMWNMNRDALNSDIDDIISGILSSFADLEEICIFADWFDAFLDEIKIVAYHNRVEISSHYSSYKDRVFGWDSVYEIVAGYVEKIVKRGDIILADFELWDDTFVYTIDEKFGYHDEDEEE